MAQVVGIVVSVSLLAFAAANTSHIAVPAVLGLIIILQAVALLNSVESHVDSLEEFFAAISYEDFTRRFVTDDVDAELKAAFNRVLDRFQETRAEREVQAAYLETVVRHVPIPLLSEKSDGSVGLLNNPLRRLTGLPVLKRLDDLAAVDEGLPAAMRAIGVGEQQLLQTRVRDVPVEWRVSVSEIRVGGAGERLYALENLSGELTAREASAWRNLIRVLTHEIMNSLTPVASLAQTCESMVDDPDASEEIAEAIRTIARRSDGLMQFVGRYRELLQVPQPKYADVSVNDLLQGIVSLMSHELDGIALEVTVSPPSLEVGGDRSLIEQVLLNLVRNAAQALAGVAAPRILLEGKLDYGRVKIRVVDNGPGIPQNLQDQVFVPFFTTRRDGSGIGLSLSRQIMTAHGGELAMVSDDNGTAMNLVF